MTPPRAEDLPVGSVVVDDDRGLVWIALPARYSWQGRWSVSGSPTFITDHEINGALAYTARVLRFGGPAENEEVRDHG